MGADMTSELLIKAGAVFLLVKIVFQFLNWYASEEGDFFIRKRLDVAWELIHRTPVAILLIQAIDRLLQRILQGVRSRWRGLLFIFAFAFIFNFIANYLYEARHHYSSWTIDDGLFVFVWLLKGPVIFASIGGLLAITSTAITWYLLSRAVAAPSIKIFILHILVDWVGAILILMVSYSAWEISNGFYNELISKALFDVFQLFIRGVDLTYWDDGNSFVLALFAILPTLCHFLISILTIIAHLVPPSVGKFLTRCIWLITTDETPVLSRIGTFAGGLSAVLVAMNNL